MKGFICCLILSFSIAAGYSQKVYFMYLQSETDQPFFVKLNDKVTSSSSSGYLILSRLRDSAYTFSIGFPQNKWPEQQFRIDMAAKDHGFLVKNFGEKGWGLFDLESLAVYMAITGTTKAPTTEPKEVSDFTNILSKASDDPSLKEKPIAVVKKETPQPVMQPVAATVIETVPKETNVVVTEIKEPEKISPELQKELAKKEEQAQVQKPDSIKKETAKEEIKEKPAVASAALVDSVIKKAEPAEPPKETIVEKKPEPVVQAPAETEYSSSVVRKKSESSTVEGLGFTYIDEYKDGKKDTIHILIPNPPRTATPQPKDDKKFLDITADTKDAGELVKPAVKSSIDAEKTVKKAVPDNCNNLASDNDFLKLRKKMAAESTDDGMVEEAARAFKSKCFTVAQVKNLGSLFLNDAGKYKFFDVAYSHVPDPENFSSLQSELKEEYYVNRFKAMIR